MPEEIKWLDRPAPHTYGEAESFLRLLFSDEAATAYVERLQGQPIVSFHAKDVMRASGLALIKLGRNNKHVNKTLEKIEGGRALSPLLLVRNIGKGVIVADGFHRLCGVYLHNEDSDMRCQIV